MRLVRLRHSPNWYVEWREKGAKRRVSTGTADEGQAQGFLRDFRLSYTDDPAEEWPDVPSVLSWYYESHASKLPSAAQNRIAKDHLSAFFGSTRVDRCNLSKQEAYAEHRRAGGVSNETIRRELSILGAAFNRAKKFEKIPGEPPPTYALPPSPPRERFLTRSEAAQLLRRLRRSKRQRHLLLFTRIALATGARPGAVLSLTWDRVHFELDVIDFTIPGRAQTNKRSAVVPLPPHLRRALLAAKKGARSSYVIEWAGRPAKRIIKAFKRHAEALGLEGVTPNTQRHTFATWAGDNGAPLLLLARQLGHARTSTTERYAKRQVDPLKEVQRAARRHRGASRGQVTLAPPIAEPAK